MPLSKNFRVVTSTVLAKADWEKLLELWNSLYPLEVRESSIGSLQRLIESANCKHYVIRNQASEVEAWMAVFDRYDTRWFSILISPETQGRGVGKALIAFAKTKEPCLEGWVVQSDTHYRADGKRYLSPLAFYKKLGFTLNPNRFPTEGKMDVVCVKWENDSYT